MSTEEGPSSDEILVDKVKFTDDDENEAIVEELDPKDDPKRWLWLLEVVIAHTLWGCKTF